MPGVMARKVASTRSMGNSFVGEPLLRSRDIEVTPRAHCPARPAGGVHTRQHRTGAIGAYPVPREGTVLPGPTPHATDDLATLPRRSGGDKCRLFRQLIAV